jgi:hypothetical protein
MALLRSTVLELRAVRQSLGATPKFMMSSFATLT